MVRAFLTRGSAAAGSALVPGLRAVILLSILFASYGEQASATVGLTASYFGLALVATAGLGVGAVHTFSRHSGRPLEVVSRELGAQFRISAAATTLLIVITVIGGLLIPQLVPIDATLFRAFWFSYSGSVLVLPFTATLTGIFQSRNRDGENLLLSVGGGIVHIGLTLVSTSTGQGVVTTVMVAGIAGSVADLFALGYRTLLLAPQRVLGVRSIGAGIALFARRPIDAILMLPRSVSGAIDGLILTAMFVVAGTVATSASVGDGAIVVFVVTALRTLIIPLKQFGMAGGRLIVQRRALGESDGAGLRTLIATAAGILFTVAALVMVAKATTQLLDIVPWTLVWLMFAQLLIEPITGVAFAAMKILDRPSFGLRTLAAVSFVGTVPVLLILSFSDTATALTVWATVFGARVTFFLLLVPRIRAHRR